MSCHRINNLNYINKKIKTLNTLQKCLIGLCLLSLSSNILAQQEKVIIKEEIRKIPTYETGDPDVNPRFYEGRITQGAQGRVYPYPMYDVLKNNKVEKEYTLITLENRYVEITVLPELGGRLYSAVDKTNNYDYFYRNRVIKPSLIGTLGAWISGGVEWNFPHHHKANSMLPANYLLKENEDGSATIWISEFDKRHRFKFTMSMTLYPDKSYLEVKINPYNPNPLVHSFLYWANPAVHVDSSYQVIFPPNVQYVVSHGKNDFSEWPVSQGFYGRRDWKGTNISWWKNIPVPVSFFAWNYETDYFGGYNHSEDAGVAYVTNHHLAPGMKYFTWGNGPTGQMEDEKLTDEDGPYIELMAGGFSDNQPDYSWIKPYESKFVTQYWYPIRNLNGMQYANLNGAMNILVDGLEVQVKVITTSRFEDAYLNLMYDGNEIAHKTILIAPDAPYAFTITRSANVDKTKLRVSLKDKDGRILLQYQPIKYPRIDQPATVLPPSKPEEIETVEELYLEGLRIDQFYNGRIDADLYYQEALRRDPGNSQVNIQLGILDCKGFRWKEAEDHLSRAVGRLANNYVHPKNAEPYYYLAVTQQALGKDKEAYDNYYKACWDIHWKAPAYFALANMDCKQGNYMQALEHINRSLDYNRNNRVGMCLMAYILRKLERPQLAIEAMKKLLDEIPLDFLAINELINAYGELNKSTAVAELLLTLDKLMGNKHEEYLEIASFYMNCGAWNETIDLLSRIDISNNPEGSTYPIIYYYLGYCYDRIDETEKSLEYYKLASTQPAHLCFPYRAESLEVLKYAYAKHPEDAQCTYYIGNLLFDSQPDAAMKWWEKSVLAEKPSYNVFRNLAMGYSKIDRDFTKAVVSLEKAIELNNKDPRLFYEIDVLYETNKTDISKRLELLEKNKEIIEIRTDSKSRLVKAYIQDGQFDKAIDVLNSYHFSRWEGGSVVRDFYEDAHLLNGIALYDKKQYDKALDYFLKANEYPSNLEMGRPEWTARFAQTYFYIGLTYEALSMKKKADEYFQKAVENIQDETPYLYYQGLAFQKLNQKGESRKVWKVLQEYSQQEEEIDFFSKFAEKEISDLRYAQHNYIRGLAALSDDNKEEAENYFTKALDFDPYHYWAKSGLKHLLDL